MKRSIYIIVAIAILALVAGTALAGSPATRADRVSKLIGAEAISTNGEALGTIDDLVLGPDGHVSYLVISKAEMSGGMAKLVAVPFDAAAPQRTHDGRVVVSIDKQKLDNAPSFASNSWPDFSSGQWRDESRGYYGSQKMRSDTATVNGIESLNPYPEL
ncbi:MAG: PRC-barrel domain-containing protein [Desulfatitalea sp.]